MGTLPAGSLNDGPSLAAVLGCEQPRCPTTHTLGPASSWTTTHEQGSVLTLTQSVTETLLSVSTMFPSVSACRSADGSHVVESAAPTWPGINVTVSGVLLLTPLLDAKYVPNSVGDLSEPFLFIHTQRPGDNLHVDICGLSVTLVFGDRHSENV